MDKELDILKKGLLEAGKVALDYWHKGIKAQVKSSHYYDIVTEADYKVDEILKNIIKKNFPNDGIITEESLNNKQLLTDNFFTIDPIDGTAAFQRGLYDWSISIAQIKQGKVILGMIYCPHFNELFWARPSQGAYKNDKKIQVSKTKKIEESLINISQDFMSMYYNMIDTEISLSAKCRLTWKISSSSFAYAKLAEGKIDAAIHPKQPVWDIAAGKILVEEAGGSFINWIGEKKFDFSGLKTNNILATNNFLHQNLLTKMKV